MANGLNESAHPLHVVGVVGVLAGADAFAEVGASVKEEDEQDAADDAGVEPFASGSSGKQVEYDPNGLFAGEVRVARQAPEAGVHESFAVDGPEVWA